MNTHPHTATPTLSVIDPRTLVVRSVGYCRHPDSPLIDPRITRQRFDMAGRLVESWDPRLWGTSKPNLTTVYGLSGQPLLTDSVDAGWQLSLPDQAGSPCSFWDARGSQRHTEFDEQLRPITVTEQALGELPCVVERLTYAGSGPAFAEHNQCGQLIRHDDPAGSQIYPEYGMAAGVLQEERRFLAELEIPDWPLDPDARDERLEPQSFITGYTFNPTGELRHQTDAMGNLRTFGYDLAGKPNEVWLQVTGKGEPPKQLVSAIRYNALDQVESETAGNGVVTRAEYAADEGRLVGLQAALGSQKPLQDLNYVYDPVGNIVELHDLSQPVTHFNNQRIDPINRYRYDSLYQLVEARGWEVSQPSHGPTLPTLLPTPLDPNQRRNYTQQFEYDQGGNLITRHHSGAPGFSMFTSARSNRSLAQHDDGSLPGEGEITLGFDAYGNQRELQRGQAMDWDLRNQLSRVTLVKRETAPDDYECYRYDRPGHRLRKVGFTQSSGRTLRTEVRYLPNLEIHRQAEGEEHHVISVEAGRSNVRVLHWPQGEHRDQLRYSLSDYLGSSTLELDHEAGVLTQEHYYPFGGTACWAGKSALVAQYKTFRYSGKERDATGLYYYGYRYYAPWLQRWISTDPGGDIDGLHFYLFCTNNPISYRDAFGLVRGRGDSYEWAQRLQGYKFLARGTEEIEKRSPEKWKRLDEGIKIASEWSAESVKALEEPVVEEKVKKIASIVFFGDVPESELLSKVKVIESAVREYGAGERDIIMFKSKNNDEGAHVASRDPHKRMFIADNFLDESPGVIAWAILHEVTHFKDKISNEESGLGSLDFAYFGFKFVEVNEYETNQKLIDTEVLDKLIAQQSVESVSGDKRQKFFKTPWSKGIQKALNKDSELRTKVLLNNADSLAMLVKSIGVRNTY
ncbi:RHS repeat-associated core domain-containing protein [Pseudomonas sp. B1(2018)]|uniref:RHS repeat-associated core domain-containing protein n=1 Tax=Pseudomonas sp. B1(2018) TaxID=2233856 RepID=UPI002114EE71|nr:RHS repeat-associated core domain-containing protein [Pseudomonas sp. B1(2018)]